MNSRVQPGIDKAVWNAVIVKGIRQIPEECTQNAGFNQPGSHAKCTDDDQRNSNKIFFIRKFVNIFRFDKEKNESQSQKRRTPIINAI